MKKSSAEFDESDDESIIDTTICEDDREKIIFTRFLLHQRMIDEEKLTETYVNIFNEDQEAADLQSVLDSINQGLATTNMKITTGRCELTGNKYYLLIPIHFRQHMVWPNVTFNESTMNFIKNIIREIVASDSGLVTREQIMVNNKKLSNLEATIVLQKLVNMNYLLEPKSNKYALSVLAIEELEPFINFSYKNLMRNCLICRLRIFMGLSCPNCEEKVHVSCLRRYLKNVKHKPAKCTGCNKSWNIDVDESLDELLNGDVEIHESMEVE